MAGWFRNYPLIVAFFLLIFVSACGDLTGGSASIVISPASIKIGVSQVQFFTAYGRNSLGQLVATSAVWSVQGNIGTITSSGLFTATTTDAAGSVIAAVGSTSGTAAVTVTSKGWLTGQVTDTNFAAVIGIRVYLRETPTLGDETNSSGKYTISDVPPGTYEADINARSNTAAGSHEVTILPGQIKTQDFQLFTPTTVTTSTTSLF